MSNYNLLNNEVSEFLNTLNHPLIEEIEYLRKLIISSNNGLQENIKWNGPNYSLNNQDRITLKIHPQKVIQIIFHLGVKKKETPNKKLIDLDYSFLTWKENDRVVATFKNIEEIKTFEEDIKRVVSLWLSI